MTDLQSSSPTSETSSKSPIASILAWAREEPVQAALLAAVLGVVGYFYGFYRVFMSGSQSLWAWTVLGWSESNDLEHGWLVVPAALCSVWWRWKDFAAAKKGAWNPALALLVAGLLMFVLSVRTLQPRIGQLAIPFLVLGIVGFLWGARCARLALFPSVFLLFIIPVGFLVQRTVTLQIVTASVAASLARMLGMGVISDGAAIHALDGSFHFEVVGGCSGIRSLTAMAMLSALYVHFTQSELWKKLVIFPSSLAFALLGNLVRIFSVVVFAKLISPKVAGGLYHDYSGFIFFPIAVGGMIAFSNLLNRISTFDWRKWWHGLMAPEAPASRPAKAATAKPGVKRKATPAAAEAKTGAAPISYDY